MNAARIGILALLVAALGAYLYWVELPEAASEAAGTRVFPVDADAVTRIAIRFPDRTMELARTDADWRFVAPLAADADDAQVKGIVTSLTGAKIDRTLDEIGDDRSTFGLDDAAPRVELTAADGTTLHARIGRTTPIGSKTYVETKDGAAVGLTASNLRTVVDKQPADLRNKQLLDFADDAVARVEIAHADGPPVVLVRGEGDAWTVSPGDYAADATDVRSFLSSVRSTRAVAFVDETPTDLGAYGLEAPQLRVTITPTPEAEPMTLLIGGTFTEGESTRLYAKRQDHENVVALGDWALRSLDKDVDSLRDKTVLRFDPDRIETFSITRRGDEPLSFAKTSGTWALVDDADTPIDQTTVTRYLADLAELKGARIVQEPATDPLGFGLADPGVRISLGGPEGSVVGTILASKAGEEHHAMNVERRIVFELRDYMYARLDKAKDAFRPIAPTPEPPAP